MRTFIAAFLIFAVGVLSKQTAPKTSMDPEEISNQTVARTLVSSECYLSEFQQLKTICSGDVSSIAARSQIAGQIATRVLSTYSFYDILQPMSRTSSRTLSQMWASPYLPLQCTDDEIKTVTLIAVMHRKNMTQMESLIKTQARVLLVSFVGADLLQSDSNPKR